MPQLSVDTVVHLSCRDGSCSVGVKLNRQVLAGGRRGHIVLYSDGSRASAHVAVDIGYCQGHRVGTDIRAVKFVLFNAVVAMAQLSKDPLSTWPAVIDPAPVASS